MSEAVMSKITCAALAIFILLGCSEKVVDSSIIQYRDTLVYLPNQTDPYTGTVAYYYPNGQLQAKEHYADGTVNGLRQEWYKNGQSRAEKTIKDRKLIGLYREWYENGKLRTEKTYKNGKEDGLYRTWYRNGQISAEWAYVDGMVNGLFVVVK
ncbi:MAG: toxin-antitoxin system YwqK family antitoxin [Pseudomonadales bacterium]